MAVATRHLTVTEFMNLPEPAGGLRQELHHGELFEMPPLKHGHSKIQGNLLVVLSAALNHGFLADKEFPFRPLPQDEVWVADVAVADRVRWDATPRDGYFEGVPQIVIEVLSPSNTASEMLDRERMCLENGGREFWLVDPGRQTVKVTTADGLTRNYGAADAVPLAGFGGAIQSKALFE